MVITYVFQLQLKVELLTLEKKSADVTHKFHLSGCRLPVSFQSCDWSVLMTCVCCAARRFQVLQMLCTHLQNILKNQSSLRQRLMKPVGGNNLPIQAHLHR